MDESQTVQSESVQAIEAQVMPICQDCKNWHNVESCQTKPFNGPACQFFIQKPGRPANPNKAKPRMPRIVNQAIPAQAIPAQAIPAQAIPAQAIPAQASLAIVPESNPDLIKSKAWQENYIFLKKSMLESRFNVLITGEAGTGKNQLIYELASELNQKVIRVNCSGDMRTSSLLGRPNPDKAGQIIWQDGPITEAVKTGCWLILDEINSLDSDILFALHELAESGIARRLTISNNSETIIAHPDFRILGTMNPPGYIGVKPLNQAWLDRFQVTMSIEYCPEIDLAIIAKMGLEPEISQALVNLVNRIRDQVRTGELSQPIGHRTLDSISQVYGMTNSLIDSLNLAYANKLASFERASIQSLFKDLASMIKEVKKGN